MPSAQVSNLASKICCSLFVLTASVCLAEETIATPDTAPHSPVSIYVPIMDPFLGSRAGQHAAPLVPSDSMFRDGHGQPERVNPKGLWLKGLPAEPEKSRDRHERQGDFWVPEGFDRFASLNTAGQEVSHGRHDPLSSMAECR